MVSDLGFDGTGQKMTKKPKREVAKPYGPTPGDGAAVDANIVKARERPPAPALKIKTEKGVDKISVNHPDRRYHPAESAMTKQAPNCGWNLDDQSSLRMWGREYPCKIV